jgi:hypothetical protein
LEFGKARFRSQGRVLSACVLVGIIAGLGDVVFSIAGQLVVQVGLVALAGYQAGSPMGEPDFPWLPSSPPRPRRPSRRSSSSAR